VLVLTGVLFVVVPKGFIPDQDTDQITVTTEAAQGTSFDNLVRDQRIVSTVIGQDPAWRAGLDRRRQRVQPAWRTEPRADRRDARAAPRPPVLVGQVIERLRPELAACRACRSTCRTRRRSASADR
jgi:multidrug efflux pump subunit AcrB